MGCAGGTWTSSTPALTTYLAGRQGPVWSPIGVGSGARTREAQWGQMGSSGVGQRRLERDRPNCIPAGQEANEVLISQSGASSTPVAPSPGRPSPGRTPAPPWSPLRPADWLIGPHLGRSSLLSRPSSFWLPPAGRVRWVGFLLPPPLPLPPCLTRCFPRVKC